MDSQNAAILHHLQLGLSITPLDALRKFGCFRLAARIYELRERGHKIDFTWERHNGKRVKRYWLARKK